MTPNSKLKVERRARIPKKPVIFAATHGFREDAEHTAVMAKRQAYILNGSLPQVFNTFDGITSWIVGVILVNRADKESRAAAKEKMIYALKNGASIIMYPEGTWNKSPNQLVSGLFPGVYDVAKEAGVEVVPIATYRNGNTSYGIMESAFNICNYERNIGIQILRDKMATMQYELMEKYGRCRRSELLQGIDVDAYWERYVQDLISQAEFYEYELERYTKYREKGVTTPEEAFAFMDKLIPSSENAFLLKRSR